MVEPNRLLVVGGGIAGLAAADEALAHGLATVLVESEERTGGLLRTDRRRGYSFDHGGHRFITPLDWVLKEVQARLGDRLLLRERRSLIFLDGTTIEYPLELSNLVRTLGLGANLRAVGSYVWSQIRPRGDETHLEGWLRRRFGDYLYRRVFEGYTEKLWGRPAREISAEWAPQRITIPSLRAYLKELVAPSRRPPRTYAREYLYPRTGIGEIPERWDHDVRAAGGEVLCSSRVVGLEREGDAWVATIDTPTGTRRESFGGVAWTAPIDALVSCLRVDLPLDAPALEYRGLRFLNLALEDPVPLDATWIYQPDPRWPFTRLQIPAMRSPEMVPEGRGSLQLEEPDRPGHASLEERVALARALVESMGLGEIRIVDAFETVEPRAYPIYGADSRAKARACREACERLPGLTIAGRQGSFNYVFLDRALAEGVNAVRRLLGEELRPERPRDDALRPVPIEAHSRVGSDRVGTTGAV